MSRHASGRFGRFGEVRRLSLRSCAGPGCCAVLLAACLLTIAPARAQTVTQVTDVKTTIAGPAAIDDAGTAVFTGSSSNQLGGNPTHGPQVLRFDPTTGSGEALTDDPRGVTAVVSVSDDGQWIAFPSYADFTGQNHDRSLELFLMAASGADTRQLTDDPGPAAGSVSLVALAGGGSRAAFVSNSDYLGSNPDNRPQLFVVDDDGGALTQLTSASSGSFTQVAISDDGTRIVFDHSGDLLGQNPDGSLEIYAVLADGTGLQQLTDTAGDYDSAHPVISGNGQTIAFDSNDDLTSGNPDHQYEIFAVDWGGANLRKLTSTRTVLGVTGDPTSQYPSITDDGQRVVFFSNHSTLFSNFDGNFEIYEINTDGSGLDALTGTALSAGSVLPTVSGSGNRVTYYGVGDAIRLRAMDGNGNDDRELVTFDVLLNEQPDLADEGNLVVYRQTTDLLFGAADLWRVDTETLEAAQVTDFGSGTTNTPSITDDGEWIAFSSDANPTGGNSDGSSEIFRVRSTGADVSQLSSGPDGTSSERPVVADDGNLVVFDSNADLTGANGDGSREIFRCRLDGSELLQLTSGASGTSSSAPRADASGQWVVFDSSADLLGLNADGSREIFLVAADGSGLQQVTDDASYGYRGADVARGGQLVVFSGTGDPLGTNPEHNEEVYSYDAGGGITRQLTSFETGSSGAPRISADGQWVYFLSTAPIFEDDPDNPSDAYRVPTAGGPIERVGALRAASLGSFGPISFGGSGGLSVGADGSRAVFSGVGDFTEQNADQLSEVWLIDRNARVTLEVSKDSPTVLSWDIESGPARYDVIRGDISELSGAAGGPGTDLGNVTCLENDSPDADTRGFGDAESPQASHAFFFLYRGSPGLSDPGSYGTASDGGEREAGGGDCTP